ALDKLNLANQACAGRSCSAKTRAKIHVAIGTVLASLKQEQEARNQFAEALKEDPTAALFSNYITPEAQKAFNDARALASASSGSTESNKQAKKERRPKKRYAGQRAPKGWKSGEAAFYANEALKSEQAQEWLDCADYAQASLASENRATTRFLAASCEERAGLWIEALADYRIVADTAGKAALYDIEGRAKSSVSQLTGKIPKIVIRKPARATDLAVTMNDQEIPPEKLNGEIWVNPGQRTITAKGKVDGQEMEFEQVVDLNEGETVTVDVKLAPKGLKGRDTQIMKCMLAAQSREDFQKCLSGGNKGSTLNYHFGSEVSGYHDTDHVDVVTPALFANVESPTGGWGVGASFLVDVVTAASVDVVANASPRWREVRYAPTVNGHKKFGEVDISANASLSDEPDYIAIGAGLGVSVDLANKTVTPSLRYDFGYDIEGRSGTPFSVYSHKITNHAIEPSVTFVVDKATIFSTSFTAVFQTGDTSKPYRYVPMFDPTVFDQIPAGFAIDSVNQLRLPIRPLEQVPTSRQRYAIAGLLAHRFSKSTIRAEERLYIDNWGLKATTTDAQYLIDVTKDIRIWPALRFHAQTGVSFWELAYQAAISAQGGVTVPALRTGDRELSPLIGVTGGFGTRFAFGEKKNWALTVTGDVTLTRFFDTLYILQRYGFLGATTLEVDLE
ncbi:MAG TPA: DUF3570 domain-containing protein, partial [Minicystis sp.]|nr:DUF3570 domain-containing protein [Minicystis sp.]